MRKKLALTLAGLAAAAAVAPIASASASCVNLSAIGGSRCASLCPKVVTVNCTD